MLVSSGTGLVQLSLSVESGAPSIVSQPEFAYAVLRGFECASQLRGADGGYGMFGRVAAVTDVTQCKAESRLQRPTLIRGSRAFPLSGMRNEWLARSQAASSAHSNVGGQYISCVSLGTPIAAQTLRPAIDDDAGYDWHTAGGQTTTKGLPQSANSKYPTFNI